MKSFSPLRYKGTPVSMYLYVKDCDRIFDQAVKAGATTVMPVADMFWGDRCGTLKDPFGHQWSIATHKRDLTPEAMEEAMKQWMEQAVTLRKMSNDFMEKARKEPVRVQRSGRDAVVILDSDEYDRLVALEDASWGQRAAEEEKKGFATAEEVESLLNRLREVN